MNKTIATFAGAACLLCFDTAHAALYKLDFTAKYFASPFDDNRQAPHDYVTGSIWFRAKSLGAEVTSIDGVDLVIGSHSYTPDDIANTNFGFGTYVFGGTINGADQINGRTDDFYINAPTRNAVPIFAYTQAGRSGL